MTKASAKLKTSISLPNSQVDLWKQHARAIATALPGYLCLVRRNKFRRIGLKHFNAPEDGVARVNVYWDQLTYNQLHAAAHALCMSVSHLLWRILQLVLQNRQPRPVFSNYSMPNGKWSATCFVLTEIIEFLPKRPSLRARRRRKLLA